MTIPTKLLQSPKKGTTGSILKQDTRRNFYMPLHAKFNVSVLSSTRGNYATQLRCKWRKVLHDNYEVDGDEKSYQCLDYINPACLKLLPGMGMHES